MLMLVMLTAGAVLGWLYVVCRCTSRISEISDDSIKLVPSGFLFVMLAPPVWVLLIWLYAPYSASWLTIDVRGLYTAHRWGLLALAAGLAVLAAESARRALRHGYRRRVLSGRVRFLADRSVELGDSFGTMPGRARHLYTLAGCLPGNCISRLHLLHYGIKIPQLDRRLHGVRLLQISDLHYSGARNDAYCRRLIRWVRQLQPEIVVLTGDLYDAARHIPKLQEHLSGLTAPYGVYFVCGNHEYWDKPQKCIDALKACGFVHLDGRIERIAVNGAILRLAGTDYPWGPATLKNRRQQIAAEEVTVVASHDPDNISWLAKPGVDLVLSGHTHGGQIAIPVFGPLVVPSRRGSAHAAGFVPYGSTLLYISRGAGMHLPLRLGCPLEITMYELETAERPDMS